MTNASIYQDIATRTGGDIYVGIVGPVRTGKSTFIKRFMETLVIPNIDNIYVKERAKDELPQSGSGRTIMTAEPKFVPEDAVRIDMDTGAAFSVRLIDCVGYMVEGAVGQTEDGEPRMVTTPWFDYEIAMSEAAEIGTRKVIEEHSTIGIVVTTDGSITEIDREAYVPAEERVITELKAIGKPFLILLNSEHPHAESTERLRCELEEKYGVTCIAENCLELDENDITQIMESVLYEFPVHELGVYLPEWIDALPFEHPLKNSIFAQIREAAEEMRHIRDIDQVVKNLSCQENVENASVKKIELGSGSITAVIGISRELFYQTLSERSGFPIDNDGDLMELLVDMAEIKVEYSKIQKALTDVKTKGYGIVMPTREELHLEEPEIVKQGGRYGIKLRASAPSIHMIMANIETEVSPVVGGERQSEDIVNYLLQEFEGDSQRIWDSNIFGKSLYDIAGEGLNAKIKRMPEDAQNKIQETLQRIINEGSGGLICIIL